MQHRLTTLALAGALALGAAACADDADLDGAIRLEQATETTETTSARALPAEQKEALLDVIADVADIASIVPGILDYEDDPDTESAGDFALTCAGGLEPTVIFVGRASSTWPDVDHGELSADLFGARVCTYDVAIGGRPEPTTPEGIAAEAAAATAEIRAKGSVTVVGRSDAPEAARLFADQYPADAVGLALVDPGDGWDDLTWRDLYGRRS